jgi:hypothetical protein
VATCNLVARSALSSPPLGVCLLLAAGRGRSRGIPCSHSSRAGAGRYRCAGAQRPPPSLARAPRSHRRRVPPPPGSSLAPCQACSNAQTDGRVCCAGLQWDGAGAAAGELPGGSRAQQERALETALERSKERERPLEAELTIPRRGRTRARGEALKSLWSRRTPVAPAVPRREARHGRAITISMSRHFVCAAHAQTLCSHDKHALVSS